MPCHDLTDPLAFGDMADVEVAIRLGARGRPWNLHPSAPRSTVSDQAPPASDTDGNASNDAEQVKEVSSNRPTRQKRALPLAGQ
jgi:hypothetical protein